MSLCELRVREESGALLPEEGPDEGHAAQGVFLEGARAIVREVAQNEEQEQDKEKKPDVSKRGWLTIRRKHKGKEEVTRIYTGHDGEILEGPDHLKGRNIKDLRGEGTDESKIRKNKPEPYDRAGRFHERGGAHITQEESGRTQKGKKEREADSRRIYG